MDTIDAIQGRRSIRHFNSREIPAETLNAILDAGIRAPSGHNGQPWKFIIVTNNEKPAMLAALRAGFECAKRGEGLIQEYARYVQYAEHSVRVMEQAPVNVFVFDTETRPLMDTPDIRDRLTDLINVQSIGAAIQNMLLAAAALGIGSLWICDVFLAYREVCQWLNEPHGLIAAVSFGFAEENPAARPRKPMEDVVVWR